MANDTPRKPRIVLYDLETTHNVVAAFRLWDRGGNSIPHTNVIQERYIVCACWKELGEKTVHSVATSDDLKRFRKNPHDDYHVVKKLHDVLSNADVIVAHNGDQYDLKFLRGRIIAHGLAPLPPIVSVDTKKIAASQFLFNSNRLDYLGKFLGVGRKIETSSGLWLNILMGDIPTKIKAIKEMVVYNKQDVLLLEDIFKKLQPYIKQRLFGRQHEPKACPKCGSTHFQSRGTQAAITRVYRRFQCVACGGWFRDDKPEAVAKPQTRAA